MEQRAEGIVGGGMMPSSLASMLNLEGVKTHTWPAPHIAEPGIPMPQGRTHSVAQILCKDEDETPDTRFIDRHNGWGLTALHIAVFQGSVHTGECGWLVMGKGVGLPSGYPQAN